MIEIWTSDDVGAFLGRAGAWLERDAERHNLPLGICHGLVRAPREAWFVVASRGEAVVAVALQTPPFRLVLACAGVDEEAVEALVGACEGRALVGVVGPREAARAFAERWQALHGGRLEAEMPLRTFALRAVQWPQREVAGALRAFLPEEAPLLARWSVAFAQEANAKLYGGDPDAAARRMIEEGRAWAWDANGEVVSMAASIPAGPCARISYVYTPPPRRGQGLASACVAALSQRLLDQGFGFCALNTDLRNPTSNKIYQALGYRPVDDLQEWTFLEE
jgi:GNAT superfamily N-acetyltransferase